MLQLPCEVRVIADEVPDSTLVVSYGYACSFVFEDQFGAGDWAGAGGWVSWADDAVSDTGSA